MIPQNPPSALCSQEEGTLDGKPRALTTEPVGFTGPNPNVPGTVPSASPICFLCGLSPLILSTNAGGRTLIPIL